LAGALTIEQILSSIAVRIDGPRVWDQHVVVSWEFTDLDAIHITELRSGTLIHRASASAAPNATRVVLTKPTFLAVIAGALPVADATASGVIEVHGDVQEIAQLFDAVGSVDPDFPIVTPRVHNP
jgi:alkyl sulfatase BDS1-like metallo-beta-lactamase superfamily hydrolase